MKIKTLIVDDMALAREKIRRHLAEDPEIEIVGECVNGREAVNSIKNLAPDLVFLDVQMPGIGGFEVVEIVGAKNMPHVIFVTAHDEFALKADEINAINYILKPFAGVRKSATGTMSVQPFPTGISVPLSIAPAVR